MNLGYWFDLRQLRLVLNAFDIRLRHRLVGQASFFMRICPTAIAGILGALFYHFPQVPVGYMWRFFVYQIPAIGAALVSHFLPGD